MDESVIRDMTRVAETTGAVNLAQGFPDFPCPAELKDAACAAIRDDGGGIPPEVQKHLFEPFRTKKPRGTGLGLFLSRTFMRRFGGDVRLVHMSDTVRALFELTRLHTVFEIFDDEAGALKALT